MTGVNAEGIKVVVGSRPTCRDKHSPSIDELTGLGPESERDGAIIALAKRCRWTPARLAELFGLSERQVYRVLADFDAEYEELR